MKAPIEGTDWRSSGLRGVEEEGVVHNVSPTWMGGVDGEEVEVVVVEVKKGEVEEDMVEEGSTKKRKRGYEKMQVVEPVRLERE